MTNDNYNVFKTLCQNLSEYDYLRIPSPPYQKRRAAVAAILRWHRSRTDIPVNKTPIHSIEDFFNQDWVKQDTEGQAEILFMQRTSRVGDRWSGHVSFVGGKNEKGETDEDTVKREVMEEIGLDLNNTEQYKLIGQLDQREISSIRDNKLLMILVPFVFLQITPDSPPFQLQPDEVAAVQWVPLSYFLSKEEYSSYKPIREELNLTRTKSKWLKRFTRFMLGSVEFPSYYLPTNDETRTASTDDNVMFRLWGLTLGMTKDIIEMTQPQVSSKQQLTFLKPLVGTKRYVYTRPDIGYLAYWIAKIRYFFLAKEDTSNRMNAEWDKVYFSSIKSAVVLAVLFRLSVASFIVSLIVKKLILKKKVLQ